MMNNERGIEADLQAVKRIFVDYPKLHDTMSEELIKVSSERQDLLHALEFGKLDAIRMSQLMRDLKEVQVKRRKLKNNLEVLDEIKRFAFKKIKSHDINGVISRVNYITKKERSYTMRVRKDLQKLVEG